MGRPSEWTPVGSSLQTAGAFDVATGATRWIRSAPNNGWFSLSSQTLASASNAQNDPGVKANPDDYSATYEIPGLGFAMHQRVDHSGNVEGTGYEPIAADPTVRRTFALRNGQIEAALLTATKAYANGKSETLERVFINRPSWASFSVRPLSGVSNFPDRGAR